MRIKTLADEYMKSLDYTSLRENTRKHYAQMLNNIYSTFGNKSVNKLTTKECKLAYDDWCDRGVSLANHVLGVANVVLNYGVRMEHVQTNPFAAIRRRTVRNRRVVWTTDNVKQLLDYAYSDFRWRNIGLIAQMAYEWCQRVGDMRMLTWDSIDFDNKRCNIEQSKRRAEVFLPISEELFDMLTEQHDDFGFQEFVVPRPRPIAGKYQPYTMFKLSKYAKILISEAGLPQELRLSDLRRTGTTEMVEAGVGIAQIMSVTGHANPQSVKPYIKNTYDSANYALTARKNRDI
jgi:integrase